MEAEIVPLVIECGSCWTKVGYSGEDFPCSVFKTVVAKSDKVCGESKQFTTKKLKFKEGKRRRSEFSN